MMNNEIKFGTDGWRSIMGESFTYDNVRRVAQATCDVLRQKSKTRLILIGYDHRFLSEDFALTAARVAVENGYRVEISDQPITSPVLSYQVKTRKATIGIMITASHNPPPFNGFKLKGPHGGSVDESLTRQIEEQIDISEPRWGDSVGKRTDFVGGYLKWLKKLTPLLSLSKLKETCVLDSMYGPGGNIFENGFGSKITHLIRKESDPLFGGINPEPIEKNLKFLKEVMIQKKAGVGLALDGDGDRVGVIDNKGRYLPPHLVMPLLMEHLIVNRKLKGDIIQTVSMGYLPERIAKEHKLGFEEVPVGFKHVASKIRDKKVLFGGEESGGYGVGLWSAERDGLLCSLLILEALCKTKKSLSDLIDQLQEKYGQSIFKRVDFRLKESIDKELWTQKITNHIGSKFGKHVIRKINPLDGVKVIMEDDSWVLMRPSGTEPLIRTYSEAKSAVIVNELLSEAERLVQIPMTRQSKQSGRKEAGSRKKSKHSPLVK
ncbi:hypothetical protein BVX98_04095 [bacterium F11]|nr:hypothetical protein BVX98_04095 [bacterium F11]